LIERVRKRAIETGGRVFSTSLGFQGERNEKSFSVLIACLMLLLVAAAMTFFQPVAQAQESLQRLQDPCEGCDEPVDPYPTPTPDPTPTSTSTWEDQNYNVTIGLSIPGFRQLVNPSGVYLYTSDTNERNSAIANFGLRDTNRCIGSTFRPEVVFTPATTVPLRRYRNQDNWFWTIDVNEGNNAAQFGYQFEGISGYVFPNQSAAGAAGYQSFPITRYRRSDFRGYLYTVGDLGPAFFTTSLVSPNEVVSVDARREGVAWWSPVPNFFPGPFNPFSQNCP
jgi:hypothetical protein